MPHPGVNSGARGIPSRTQGLRDSFVLSSEPESGWFNLTLGIHPFGDAPVFKKTKIPACKNSCRKIEAFFTSYPCLHKDSYENILPTPPAPREFSSLYKL